MTRIQAALKNKQQNKSLTPQIQPEERCSVLGKGTTIRGEFESSEDMAIEGTLIGNLVCLKKIIIRDTGVIEGSVEAPSIVVEGKIEGDITCTGTVVITATASIEGKITAANLDMEEDAVFNGSFSSVKG